MHGRQVLYDWEDGEKEKKRKGIFLSPVWKELEGAGGDIGCVELSAFRSE